MKRLQVSEDCSLRELGSDVLRLTDLFEGVRSRRVEFDLSGYFEGVRDFVPRETSV